MAETTEEFFEQAVSLHLRRLLAIARAIIGNRASAEDVVQQAVMNLVTLHPPATILAGRAGSLPVCSKVRNAMAMVWVGSWPRSFRVR